MVVLASKVNLSVVAAARFYFSLIWSGNFGRNFQFQMTKKYAFMKIDKIPNKIRLFGSLIIYHIVFVFYGSIRARLNPITARLFNLNFHPLEVVSRGRDPQLQVSENYPDLTKWRSTLFRSCWLKSHFKVLIIPLFTLSFQLPGELQT